jgi:hypothetical protein
MAQLKPPPASFDDPFELGPDEPTPPAGAFAATCIQVKDISQYPFRKFQSSEIEPGPGTAFLFGFRDPNNPHLAYKAASRVLKQSGHRKANLVKFYTALLGKAPEFYVDHNPECIHKQVLITIKHHPSNDGSRVYVYVEQLGPLPAGMSVTPAPAAGTPPPAQAPLPSATQPATPPTTPPMTDPAAAGAPDVYPGSPDAPVPF